MFKKECCVKCFYVRPVGNSTKLQCKRFPFPTAYPVGPGEWCGEYKLDPKAATKCKALFAIEKAKDLKLKEKEKAKKLAAKPAEEKIGKKGLTKEIDIFAMGDTDDTAADKNESN